MLSDGHRRTNGLAVNAAEAHQPFTPIGHSTSVPFCHNVVADRVGCFQGFSVARDFDPGPRASRSPLANLSSALWASRARRIQSIRITSLLRPHTAVIAVGGDWQRAFTAIPFWQERLLATAPEPFQMD